MNKGEIMKIMAQMPSPLDQGLAAHGPEQMLAALDASARPGEEPLAFSEQQGGHLAGVGTVSQADTPPGLEPPSHSWTAAPPPSPCPADPRDPPPILWLCP